MNRNAVTKWKFYIFGILDFFFFDILYTKWLIKKIIGTSFNNELICFVWRGHKKKMMESIIINNGSLCKELVFPDG